MNVNELFRLSEHLTSVISRNAALLDGDAKQLADIHGIGPTAALQKTLEKLDQENRLLHIGIVGRVKAGKSSLLNALLFDGQEVLPKAATPMTAALTMLSYSETLSATVEFYSRDDLLDIRRKSAEYVADLDREVEAILAEGLRRTEKASSLMERAKERIVDMKDQIGGPASRQKAEREAHRRLKENVTLSAAHEHVSLMEATGLDPAQLGVSRELQADDLTGLSRALREFVASGGSHMPFTKSVHIRLPLTVLQNVVLIDTPGLDDPVVSRESRTLELLNQCDVVFVVSPAGQFLTENDLSLMGRLTQKEGVREVYMVASQVDLQLFGSEKEPRLEDALKGIGEKLGAHLSNTLRNFRNEFPSLTETIDALITAGSARVISSSGVAQSILIGLTKHQVRDENAEHVWNLLLQNYPDDFPHDNPLAATSLQRLANIDSLRVAIDDAKGKKDAILERRRQDLVNAKLAALNSWRLDIVKWAKDRIDNINSGDIKELQGKNEAWLKEYRRCKEEITEVYDDFATNLCNSFHTILQDSLKNAFSSTTSTVRAAEETKSESYTARRSGVGAWFASKLWGGGTETRYESVTTVRTNQVCEAIKDFINVVGDEMSGECDMLREKKRLEFKQSLIKKIRAIFPDGSLDPTTVKRSVEAAVIRVNIPAFEIDHPSSVLNRGNKTLKDVAAREYLDEVNSFLKESMRSLKNEIGTYTIELRRTLGGYEFASTILQDYSARLKQLEKDIGDKHAVIENLQKFILHLEMGPT